MKRRFIAAALGALAVAIAVASLSSSTIAGQTPLAGAKANPPATKAYVAPRTPNGHPDLQGVWANNDATPLQRPKELEGRSFLTDTEVAALKRRAAELFNGETDAAFGDSVYIAVLKDAKISSPPTRPQAITTISGSLTASSTIARHSSPIPLMGGFLS